MATIKEKVGTLQVPVTSSQICIDVCTAAAPACWRVHNLDGLPLARAWRPLHLHSIHLKMCDAGEVMEKAGKAFTDTGKVGKKFNPDHPEGTAGELQIRIHLSIHIFCCSALHSCTILQAKKLNNKVSALLNS